MIKANVVIGAAIGNVSSALRPAIIVPPKISAITTNTATANATPMIYPSKRSILPMVAAASAPV